MHFWQIFANHWSVYGEPCYDTGLHSVIYCWCNPLITGLIGSQNTVYCKCNQNNLHRMLWLTCVTLTDSGREFLTFSQAIQIGTGKQAGKKFVVIFIYMFICSSFLFYYFLFTITYLILSASKQVVLLSNLRTLRVLVWLFSQLWSVFTLYSLWKVLTPCSPSLSLTLTSVIYISIL